jgi:hypothetical protein
MCRRFLSIAVVVLAGSALLALGCSDTQSQRVVDEGVTQDRVSFRGQQAAGRVYEGRIKDARPAWDLLILTVGEGKEARDLRFDIGEARIVGPSGAEWKGQDLHIGDRVRVKMADDGTLVQQLSVLPD